ncbi:unnamed protein product [Paramecium octaurelia]|uniref:Uncharacterized protein n=1 Tax=Paramecium octaurelia TaxID=43137 RepID=A0A8S1YNK0_PAROT|nr:unnamed protein product [Paramecium octaurelia]
MKYKVGTDLINARRLNAPQRKYLDELSVKPKLSGQYYGSITFQEENVKISTQVRKPDIFEIELSNPMPFEQATFEGRIEGDNLHGSKTSLFQLKCVRYMSSIIYHFCQKRKKELLVLFMQNWGRCGIIRVQYPKRQNIKIPLLKTIQGKFEECEIQLENPIDKEVNVQIQISNPANFDVLPADIVLKPYCDTSLYIKFTPNSLDQIKNAEIRFITEKIENWEFLVYGVGIPPNAFPEFLRIFQMKSIQRIHSEIQSMCKL